MKFLTLLLFATGTLAPLDELLVEDCGAVESDVRV